MQRRSLLKICCASLSGLMAGRAVPAVPVTSPTVKKAVIEDELCTYQAIDLAGLIRQREISVTEMLQAHLRLIERVNPVVNAICTLVPEQALKTAGEMDSLLARGQQAGRLSGLPIAIKDLTLTRGIRTTLGSPIYSDFVPDQDALYVQRLKTAGAIIIGKTNTPEFGAGSHTFNEVFGITRNPYDITKTCGGSSGGAAVALATGMLPIADGSDLAGSLRNPAAYCNIVGFRPSPGRVPDWPTRMGESPLPVSGPMGRTVKDVAWLLSVMAGPDTRVAQSIDEDPTKFLQSLDRDFSGTRIAWTADLGLYPIDPVVVKVCTASLSGFSTLGCDVLEAHPDLSAADGIFQTLRAHMFATLAGVDYRQHRDRMKDTVVWNVEQGLALTVDDIARAEQQRLALVAHTAEFFEQYDFLVLPAVQVPPFPVETEWVREINGTRLETYIDWMAICSAITVTGLPAVSVPCGFTPEGLPIGLQIVGRPQGDFELLQMAHVFEQATGFGSRKPALLNAV